MAYHKTDFLYLLPIYQLLVNRTTHDINHPLLNGAHISSVQTKAASDRVTGWKKSYIPQQPSTQAPSR